MLREANQAKDRTIAQLRGIIDNALDITEVTMRCFGMREGVEEELKEESEDRLLRVVNLVS